MVTRASLRYPILGLTLMAAGCAPTLNVKLDTNPTMSVSICRTYAFAQEVTHGGPQAAFGNPVNADRLRAAIESNMAAKGIQRVADGQAPDCVVGYAIGTRQVFSDYYGYWGYYGYGGWGRPYYGWGWGPGWDGPYPYVEDETRITVDIFDGKSRKAIWHASVSQTVSDLRGPNADAKINAAATAIFAKLPALGPSVAAPMAPPAAAPAAPPAK